MKKVPNGDCNGFVLLFDAKEHLESVTKNVDKEDNSTPEETAAVTKCKFCIFSWNSYYHYR